MASLHEFSIDCNESACHVLPRIGFDVPLSMNLTSLIP